MKNCLHCKHADWKRTEAGKLHPSGDGRCQYPWKMPQLPASMYWIGRSASSPCGGHVSRKDELKDHCAYFGRNDARLDMTDDDNERRTFDAATEKLYGGDALANVEHTLDLMSRAVPQHGSFARLLAICANEVGKARTAHNVELTGASRNGEASELSERLGGDK